MSAGSEPGRLAAALGIEHGYHDIWGQWHALSDPTARSLLTALGVDASSDAALADAHEQLCLAPWQRALAAVTVLHRAGPGHVAVTVPEEPSGHIRFSLLAEDGTVDEGEVAVADLPVLEEIEVAGVRRRRVAFTPPSLPPGYHRLEIDLGDGMEAGLVIVAPGRCHPPPPPGGDGRPREGRPWGLALQLFSLRSERNWGLGDFSDLTSAIDVLAPLGADVIGLNPLHALFPDQPERASPYSASSRRFLNPLYIDPEAVPEYAECAQALGQVGSPGFQETLGALRAAPLVDYPGVAGAKLPILALLHAHFHTHHREAGSERGRAFEAFVEAEGEALRSHAAFEVLHEQSAAREPREMPTQGSAQAADAVASHPMSLERQMWLQWVAQDQLDRAARRARELGMTIGLYRDLAVGSDSLGADVWADPGMFASNVSVGAPPDDFALQGQVWGLAPWSPPALEASGYRAFVDVLRANMRSAGALRIDHVIGLMRQFWVPTGGNAADGAYVRFPVHDLLAVLALESERAGCVVIGEDLGTVPDEMRALLHDYGVLSYKVLYFEKHWHGDHSFRAPHEYPHQALVTVTTHDLPTFAGWWIERDLDVRSKLGLFPDEGAQHHQREGRAHDRDRLLRALASEGLCPDRPVDGEVAPPTSALVEAMHRYAARTPAAIMVVQMEDVLGCVDQVNVPGTVLEQPNWRRKLPLPVEQWRDSEPLIRIAGGIACERAGA